MPDAGAAERPRAEIFVLEFCEADVARELLWK